MPLSQGCRKANLIEGPACLFGSQAARLLESTLRVRAAASQHPRTSTRPFPAAGRRRRRRQLILVCKRAHARECRAGLRACMGVGAGAAGEAAGAAGCLLELKTAPRHLASAPACQGHGAAASLPHLCPFSATFEAAVCSPPADMRRLPTCSPPADMHAHHPNVCASQQVHRRHLYRVTCHLYGILRYLYGVLCHLEPWPNPSWPRRGTSKAARSAKLAVPLASASTPPGVPPTR